EFFTQEVRFASLSDSAEEVDWVIGLIYSRERLEAVEAYDFFGSPSLRFRWDDADADSKAIFGQVTYPSSPAFRVTGGLRYTDESKTQYGSATTFDATGTIPTTVATGGSNDEERVTWRFGLEHDAT